MTPPATASRRTVTVLFCDIVDSTSFSEQLDVETQREVQRAYFDAVAGVVERHGGVVEKYIGDAVMAVFGLPMLHEDDALRALRAASDIHESLLGLDEKLARDHGLTLRVRVGVSTGEVIAGNPDDGHGFATGETVVIAERLERAAAPGEVLVADSTYRLSAGAAAVEPVEPVQARGISQPVSAWRLLGVRAGAPGMPRRLDTPLVGRRAELDRLRAAFDDAVTSRRCRLVTVLGPAGIGKTRLTREFLGEVAEEATVRTGSCPSYGDGITFWPVRDVLPDESFEGTTTEIFTRVQKAVEKLAGERPVVLCFDDIHLAEPTFIDLVEYLAGWVTDAPFLLLCTARPELPQLRSPADVIALEPLTDDEAEALLGLLGAAAEVRGPIEQVAEGNPLFLEQMTAMAAETGGEVVVPASVRVLVAARIDRLAPDERAAIELGAVIGSEFALLAAAALAEDDITGPLLSLVRKDLLSAGSQDRFVFLHGLIREAAYEAIPKAVRADLHERHARWLTSHGGQDFVVGYHLEQAFQARSELGTADADLAREAGELLVAAAVRAHARNDMPAALTLFRRSLALLPDDFPQRARMLGALGTALLKAGSLEEAGKTLDETIELARDTGDRRSELRAVVERQQLRSFTEPEDVVEKILQVAGEAIPALEEIGDDYGLAKAWRLQSDAHIFACRWEARAQALEQAIVHARRAPEAKPDVSTYVGLLADALHYGPTRAQDAIVRCDGFLEEAGDDLALRAAVTGIRGALLAMRGRFDEARAAYAESVEIHERLGLNLRRVSFSLKGAEIASLAGDFTAAEAELRFAHAQLESMGDRGELAIVSAALADALVAQGRDEAAVEFANVAAALAQPEDVAAQIMQLTVRARLGVRLRHAAAAEGLAREAAELAATTDFLDLQASAALGLAEVLRAAGKTEEASQQEAAARAAYEQKGNIVALERLAAVQGATRPLDIGQ